MIPLIKLLHHASVYTATPLHILYTFSVIALVTAVLAWPCQTGSQISQTMTVLAPEVRILVLLLRDSKCVPKKSKVKLLLVAAQHSQKYRCVDVPGRQLIIPLLFP